MPPRPPTSEPAVAVLITADEEEREPRGPVHARIFDALEAEIGDATDVEVVLADGRAEPTGDVRPAAGRPRPWATRLARPGRSRGALRNAGLSATTAPLVVLLGDDVLPPRGWLAAHRAFHARAGGDAVCVGPVLFPPALREDPFRRWLEDSGALFGVSYTRPDPRALATFFHGANTSLPRRLLARAGPFREDFEGPVLDDDEMGRRLRDLGAAFACVPETTATHDHAVTFAERRRSVRAHGRAAAVLDAGAGPGAAWPADLRRSGARLAARAFLARVRAVAIPTEASRARHYRRALAAEFARGYREARAGRPTG